MVPASFLFYFPSALGSIETLSSHWILDTPNEYRNHLLIGSDPSHGGLLEGRLKSDPPDLLIDLGVSELFEELSGASSLKSQRFLECCPYPTRLAVDLRPFVFAPVSDLGDLELWDAVGKQLAWRLSAHNNPVALIWESRSPSTGKPLAILRDSIELWSGPELVHHNEPKPPEGGAIPLPRLREWLEV